MRFPQAALSLIFEVDLDKLNQGTLEEAEFCEHKPRSRKEIYLWGDCAPGPHQPNNNKKKCV